MRDRVNLPGLLPSDCARPLPSTQPTQSAQEDCLTMPSMALRIVFQSPYCCFLHTPFTSGIHPPRSCPWYCAKVVSAHSCKVALCPI